MNSFYNMHKRTLNILNKNTGLLPLFNFSDNNNSGPETHCCFPFYSHSLELRKFNFIKFQHSIDDFGYIIANQAKNSNLIPTVKHWRKKTDIHTYINPRVLVFFTFTFTQCVSPLTTRSCYIYSIICWGVRHSNKHLVSSQPQLAPPLRAYNCFVFFPHH